MLNYPCKEKVAGIWRAVKERYYISALVPALALMFWGNVAHHGAVLIAGFAIGTAVVLRCAYQLIEASVLEDDDDKEAR